MCSLRVLINHSSVDAQDCCVYLDRGRCVVVMSVGVPFPCVSPGGVGLICGGLPRGLVSCCFVGACLHLGVGCSARSVVVAGQGRESRVTN